MTVRCWTSIFRKGVMSLLPESFLLTILRPGSAGNQAALDFQYGSATFLGILDQIHPRR